MRIAAINQHGVAGWPTLELDSISAGLNTIYGPARTGKTAMADLVGHALFGKAPATVSVAGLGIVPTGDIIVESDAGRYRVRRQLDDSGHTRLTVAALDESPVDRTTVRRLVGGLSPTVLGALCAVSFQQPLDVSRLLSAEFASGWQKLFGGAVATNTRRISELASRRDTLAQELESRISSERLLSKELDTRWRESDQLVRQGDQESTHLDHRLKAVEASLAETDARLRYRRLELNVELQWHANELQDIPEDNSHEQVTRLRAVLAELAQREATVRGRLAQVESTPNSINALNEQRTWLAVARQLAADLGGEVSRLARATASQQCVCRDAHPRLRPIAETIQRQLGVLEKLFDEQHQSTRSREHAHELEHLVRSQAELRRHLDHLINRSQTQIAARRGAASASLAGGHDNGVTACFSAADAEQLESRRLELEQERFRLEERLRSHERKLREVRSEREVLDRQRASLLSARSIDHVQRELATVQQKLEQAAHGEQQAGEGAVSGEGSARASDFLAQLTDGRLVQLVLIDGGRRACVLSHAGVTAPVDSLSPAERGQVYLSLCLALLSAASRQSVWLPLVLDEPFTRLDARGTAALAAVLSDFCRQGHQVIVFTGEQAGTERMAAVGAQMFDILARRQRPDAAAVTAIIAVPKSNKSIRTGAATKRTIKRRDAETPRRKTQPSPSESNNTDLKTDRSDAA